MKQKAGCLELLVVWVVLLLICAAVWYGVLALGYFIGGWVIDLIEAIGG